MFFVFFGTITSYNFIKYTSYIITGGIVKNRLKSIILLTTLSLFGAFFCFLKLNSIAQICSVFFGLVSLFYLLPIGVNKTNLRNLAGLKIYIVAFSWAGVTFLLPILNSFYLNVEFLFLEFVRRFLFVLILILIFEINDLKNDDLRLKTVPQSIGIPYTKNLIYFLLFIFVASKIIDPGKFLNGLIENIIIGCVIFVFTYFASDKKSKYYTLFWVESIPIFWFLTFSC